MKLLCLHGWRQSASIFLGFNKQLLKKLKSEFLVEAVVVDAPSEVEVGSGFRQWWYYNDNDRIVEDLQETTELERRTYIGWEESLALLHEVMVKEQIDGVLGFSQGAAAASMLAALPCDSACKCHFCETHQLPAPPSPKFVILVSGFANPYPQNALWYPPVERKLAIPSLHVIGVYDQRVVPSRSRTLCELYSDDPVKMVHEHTYTQGAGHFIPQKQADIPVFLAFFKEITKGGLLESGRGFSARTQN